MTPNGHGRGRQESEQGETQCAGCRALADGMARFSLAEREAVCCPATPEFDPAGACTEVACAIYELADRHPCTAQGMHSLRAGMLQLAQSLQDAAYTQPRSAYDAALLYLGVPADEQGPEL